MTLFNVSECTDVKMERSTKGKEPENRLNGRATAFTNLPTLSTDFTGLYVSV